MSRVHMYMNRNQYNTSHVYLINIDKPDEAKSQSKVQAKSKNKEKGIWPLGCH